VGPIKGVNFLRCLVIRGRGGCLGPIIEARFPAGLLVPQNFGRGKGEFGKIPILGEQILLGRS